MIQSGTVSNAYERKSITQSPKKIFIAWVLLVFVLNLFAPHISNKAKKVTPLLRADSWPPRDIMDSVSLDNRVVVAITNSAMLEMTDNFLSSLERLGVTNFVVVPLDKKTHESLSVAYPGHILPPMPSSQSNLPNSSQSTQPVNHENLSFQSIVSVRANILHAIAKAGYTMFYCDVDSVWRTNVFTEIDRVMVTNDHWGHQFDAFMVDDSSPSTKRISSAQMYLKPSHSTLVFLEKWLHHKDQILIGDDQHALNDLIQKKMVYRGLQTIVLRFDEGEDFQIMIGQREKYPTGWMYFGTDRKKPELTKEQKQNVAIVHNNYKRDYKTKIIRFQQEGLWNPSGRLPQV